MLSKVRGAAAQTTLGQRNSPAWLSMSWRGSWFDSAVCSARTRVCLHFWRCQVLVVRVGPV